MPELNMLRSNSIKLKYFRIDFFWKFLISCPESCCYGYQITAESTCCSTEPSATTTRIYDTTLTTFETSDEDNSWLIP